MRRSNGCKHKIGVIGTINRDRITHPDSTVVNSWGGILYNLKFLNAFPELTIYPAVNIGDDCRHSILNILKNFENVDSCFVRIVKEDNNYCLLTYKDQSAKSEILKGGVPPLVFRDISGLVGCELVLLNFISGKDVSLKTLEKFRREYSGTIYIDLHSLTLGRRKGSQGAERYLRLPRLWRRYVACADILQINRVEFELLSRQSFSPQNGRRFFQCLGPNIKCMIVTLGDNGCMLFISNGEPKAVPLPADPVTKIYDTTGCGDVFSAGFIGRYLESGNFIASAKSGNKRAANRCRVRSPLF